MSLFWIGLVVGIFIGALIGLVTACLLVAARQADKDIGDVPHA